MPLSQTGIFVFNQEFVTNQSMAATFNSPSYEVKEVKTLAIQAVWSGGGSPVGNIELQGSLDDITFTRIQGSVLSVDGNSGSNAWNVQDVGYPYIRVLYVRTSGSATMNIKISGKTI